MFSTLCVCVCVFSVADLKRNHGGPSRSPRLCKIADRRPESWREIESWSGFDR